MATVELAAALSPYANYLVASEELEPGHGWNYTPVLEALQQDPAMTGDRLGRIIADHYRLQAQDQGTDGVITLSVVDLTKVEPIVKELEAFLAEVESELANTEWLLLFQRARVTAESYGSEADMVDLKDLVSRAALLAPDEARELMAAIEDAVVYNINGVGTPRASGLSIYFPHDGREAIADTLARYREVGFVPRYQSVIETYAEATFSDTEGVALVKDITAVETEDEVLVYSVQLDPEQVDEVAAVRAWAGRWLDAEGHRIEMLARLVLGVDFDPETGVVSAAFPDYIPTLNGHPIGMILDEEGPDYRRYTVPILLNGEPMEVIILGDVETGRFTIPGAWPGLNEAGLAQKQIVRIKPGDRITPVLPVIDFEAGDFIITYGEEFVVKAPLQLLGVPTPPGVYAFGFEIEDWAGNVTLSDTLAVELAYDEGYDYEFQEYWGYWDVENMLWIEYGPEELEQIAREAQAEADTETFVNWSDWFTDAGEQAHAGEPGATGEAGPVREAPAGEPEPAGETGSGAVRVILAGQELTFDVPPHVQDGVLMLPLRSIAEAMGATVTWDPETWSATVRHGEAVVWLQIGNATATLGGEPFSLTVPPLLSGSRTLVPWHFFTDALGAAVEWDEPTGTVTITPIR